MQKLKIEFELERETKNTVRYQEVSDLDRPAVGTLYITKDALGGKDFPEELTVVISNGGPS